MRILYLSAVGVLGGAERSLLDLIASVRRFRPEAELAVLIGMPGPLAEHCARLGARSILLPMPQVLSGAGETGLRTQRLHALFRGLMRDAFALPIAVRTYARRLRTAVLGFRPDVIHSNGIKMHVLTRMLGAHDCRIVWHVRDFLTSRPMTARLLRWASSNASLALAISKAVAADASAALPRLPVERLYNAVDTSHFCPGPVDASALDQLAGLSPAPSGTIRIGLVATFARWKGHDIFLRAASRLLGRLSAMPLRFYIVGGPIYRTSGSQWSLTELQLQARSLGLGDKVGFVSFQPDTLEIYRALDVVVHASTRPEPFGRTIVEAMACARPVVISRAGGAAELFEDEFDAIGVPLGDSEALAMAIARLATDTELRRRLGTSARLTAVQAFDRERLGHCVCQLYDRLLHRKAA